MENRTLMIREFLQRNRGIKWALITLSVLLLFKLSPWLAEYFYREFLFQIFRFVWDCTIGLLPFPLICLLLVALPFILYFYIRKFERRWSSLLLFPLNFFGWVITFFFWMWGFNYCAPSLVNDDSSMIMTEQELYAFGLEMAESVNWYDEHGIDRNRLKNEVLDCTDGSNETFDVRLFLSGEGRSFYSDAKCHFLNDGGAMRRLGVAGIYWPFVGQGQSSNTHHYLFQPFVAAHELSHAYGITGEGEADYVAYKSLMQESIWLEKEKHYCAELELLRSIRSLLYVTNDSLRMDIDSTLRPAVMNDIIEMRENAKLYPEYFSGFQEKMNDRYLKTMGVTDGSQNYDRFVVMVWNERKN